MNRLKKTALPDWLTEEEIAVLDISSYDEHSRVGFVFEVDLDVPDALHGRQND